MREKTCAGKPKAMRRKELPLRTVLLCDIMSP